ncbi:MAM and LDL-receptor class A domain-containing protein 1-like [Haliotis cracherodii]|uniref:MAM and LDL-receptor class A domain-containing protein 1-like n=1 Tax=Haliotis cracherodii TaxID=6455 RepID=UPI0039EBF8FA
MARGWFLQIVLMFIQWLAGNTFFISDGKSVRNTGVMCMTCNDVTRPEHCTAIEQCGVNEICYARGYTDANGLAGFRLGCESVEICTLYHNAMNIFGRRDLEEQPHIFFECCNSDRCNQHLHSSYVSPMTSQYPTWTRSTSNFNPWVTSKRTSVTLLTTRPTAGPWRTTAPSSSKVASKLDCDFDQNMCTWVNSDKDNYDWNLRRGPTDTQGTGPQTDVSGNGQYVYMQAVRNGETAMLESPTVMFSTRVCLEFWYHMYGADIGTLSLLKEDSKGYTTIWVIHGSQGNQWKKGLVDLPVGSPYLLTFYAVTGGGTQGDIALDDIRTTTGTCITSA